VADVAAPLAEADPVALARQRARHAQPLAAVPGEAVAAIAQGLDLDLDEAAVAAPALTPGGQRG
jgi:hypothetical protein